MQWQSSQVSVCNAHNCSQRWKWMQIIIEPFRYHTIIYSILRYTILRNLNFQWPKIFSWTNFLNIAEYSMWFAYIQSTDVLFRRVKTIYRARIAHSSYIKYQRSMFIKNIEIEIRALFDTLWFYQSCMPSSVYIDSTFWQIQHPWKHNHDLTGVMCIWQIADWLLAGCDVTDDSVPWCWLWHRATKHISVCMWHSLINQCIIRPNNSFVWWHYAERNIA